MTRTVPARGTIQHRGPSSGFTLIEALVAMAIFAVGLTALIPLVVNQTRGNEDAGTRTEAVVFGQQKLEQLRALPYGELDTAVPGNDTDPDGFFARDWDVLPVTPLAGDEMDLTRVRVTVSWTPTRGATRSVTLITSRARY